MGVDATVKTTGTRCVAGGYVWNPFFTQLADPLNVRIILELSNFFTVFTKFNFTGRPLPSRVWTRKSTEMPRGRSFG